MVATVNIVIFMALTGAAISEESVKTAERKAIYFRPPPIIDYIANRTIDVFETLSVSLLNKSHNKVKNKKPSSAGTTPSSRPASITPKLCPAESSCYDGSVNQCGMKNYLVKPRIVNGHPTDPHEFPWAVQIKKKNRLGFCAGSLITDRHVLTAGHCIENKRPRDLTVSVGDHLTKILDTYEKNIRITKIIRHPRVDMKDKFENDLAILQLATPVNFSEYVKPICLPKEGTLQ